MGRGNFLPDFSSYSREPQYRMVYVDTAPEHPRDLDSQGFYTRPEFEGERVNYWDECSNAYDDFKEFLMSCLPDSFSKPPQRKWLGNDQSIIAENELFYILIADNEWSTAVVVAERNEAPGFASYWLPRIAKQIFDQIAEHYPVSVRTGPWTSGRYIQKEAA